MSLDLARSSGDDSSAKTFVNFTNHPSQRWGQEQLQAGRKYGEIIDIPFPMVSPWATHKQVQELAEEYVKKILECNPGAVLCQGEFTLSYTVITRIKEQGIPVMAACSERKVQEIVIDDGTAKKLATFVFVGFREY